MNLFGRLQHCLFLMLVLLLFISSATAGDMAPGAPPAATMKNLQTVEPRIPISDPGFTITEPGSYYLTRNIQMLISANGLNVEADNVTIDLMGYTLSGNGTGSVAGVYMNGRRNVEIRNGTIRNFGGQGIYEADTANGKSHRVIDVRVVGNSGDGIHLEGSGHMIRGCTAESNGTTGIYLRNMGSVIANTAYANGFQGIRAGQGTTVTDNTVYDNQSDGIYAQSGCTVTNNTSTSNKAGGLYAGSGSMVSGNTVRLNKGDGILVSDACLVSKNTCRDNGYLETDGAGVHVTGSDNRIEDNHILACDRGLDIDAGGNVIANNTVKSNGDNYDFVEGNQVNILLCEVPETIDWPARVTFAGNLKSNTDTTPGLSINSDEVTIDLAGHSLVGAGGADLPFNNGVRADNGSKDVVVMNGTIKNFSDGIVEIGTAEDGGLIIKNMFIDSNSGHGVYVGSRRGAIIKDCVFRNNGNALNADNSLIDGCVFFNNVNTISYCPTCTFGTNHIDYD